MSTRSPQWTGAARRPPEAPEVTLAQTNTRHPARRIAANLTIMGVAAGLVATIALPAYAMTPGSNEATFATTDTSKRMKAGEQKVDVPETAATITVARDGYAATSKAEIDAAAAAAANAAAAAAAASARTQMASYGASYSGPSVGDFLANPPYPNFDLASVYNVALQYQGVPYVYGGNTPAGFDCSGFVQYVYAQFGVALPHSSTGQGAAGTRISIDDARPGDLVIMDGHDGFYAGNGNILHAPYEGASVRVQPLWTSDYFIVRLGI
ncbi:C40 family peptidase [Rathayibacter sp. YIM 133350]|uniref:C40 family peptidase n=1 Tax=Rathayibacter sp. YIM 133350 TaxID=3131992 RepID=UPI00307E44D3